MQKRTIIHVDMDAFYASVEILDDPSLRGKPVIVGGKPEDRGVVASASYEARAFGVRNAMSSYKARKLCPQAVFIRPRMERYVEVSRKIFAILEEYTPLVEPISIDEAFLDVSGSKRLMGDAAETGKEIKERIRRETGLVASVGVAPNKFLAKLGSGLCKPDGFMAIGEDEAERILDPLPVRKIWGVGKVTSERLHRAGIELIADLKRAPPDIVRSILGNRTERILELARGLDDSPVEPREEPKSLAAERTFPRDIADAGELESRLDELAARVAARLRRNGYRAQTIQIKARYPDFTTVTRALTLPFPTASSTKIKEAARELFRNRLDREGRALRLIGVSATNLVRPEECKGLFPLAQREEMLEEVDHLVDRLQEKYGARVIRRGVPGKDERDGKE